MKLFKNMCVYIYIYIYILRLLTVAFCCLFVGTFLAPSKKHLGSSRQRNERKGFGGRVGGCFRAGSVSNVGLAHALSLGMLSKG